MKFRHLIKKLKHGYTLYINGLPIIYDGDDYILCNDMFAAERLRRCAICDGLKKYRNVELWKN